MTNAFDIFYRTLIEKLELKISRGQNRKHLMQVPANARPEQFKRGYVAKSKTSATVVNVAKKATSGIWKLTKHQVIDVAQKYQFIIPNELKPIKHLGSTGIIMLRKPPGHYFLIKKSRPASIKKRKPTTF